MPDVFLTGDTVADLTALVRAVETANDEPFRVYLPGAVDPNEEASLGAPPPAPPEEAPDEVVEPGCTYVNDGWVRVENRSNMLLLLYRNRPHSRVVTLIGRPGSHSLIRGSQVADAFDGSFAVTVDPGGDPCYVVAATAR